jgi:hypothetical protein
MIAFPSGGISPHENKNFRKVKKIHKKKIQHISYRLQLTAKQITRTYCNGNRTLLAECCNHCYKTEKTLSNLISNWKLKIRRYTDWKRENRDSLKYHIIASTKFSNQNHNIVWNVYFHHRPPPPLEVQHRESRKPLHKSHFECSRQQTGERLYVREQRRSTARFNITYTFHKPAYIFWEKGWGCMNVHHQ